MLNIEKELKESLEEELDVIIHVFKKPVKFEGNEYKEIKLDLGCLTGKDVQEVSNEMLSQGMSLGLAEVNKTFLAAMAAKSANLPTEFMDNLPAREFSNVTVRVQNFLLM